LALISAGMIPTPPGNLIGSVFFHRTTFHLILLLLPLALPSGSALAATSLSQHGITWTFAADHKTGQYANGDWWVVGPVTITKISPASTMLSGVTINGSQLNPPVGGDQGYDSRPGDMPYEAEKNAARPGGKDLSPSNPLKITTGSLISSISLEKDQARPQLKTATILTVVASEPPEGAFRPSPVGTDKTSRWVKSQLNYEILKSLEPVANAPKLEMVETYFERPWLEQNPNWTARYIHPAENQPAYGRDMANRLALGLLSLHLNYSTAEKEKLYIRLVQYGLDIYGTALEGGAWEDLGGHNQGRKMPLLLAGLALNEPDILAYADASKHFIFQEDRQTWFVTEEDVGRKLHTADDRPREPYTKEDVGIAEWGEQHTRQKVRDGRNWDAYYRIICLTSEMGHALAAHLTEGAVKTWNWAPFFAYMDRGFDIEGGNATGKSNTLDPFVVAMWNAYRKQASE